MFCPTMELMFEIYCFRQDRLCGSLYRRLMDGPRLKSRSHGFSTEDFEEDTTTLSPAVLRMLNYAI